MSAKSTLRLPELKAGFCSGLTLSRAFYHVFKGGAWRGRTGQVSTFTIQEILKECLRGLLNLKRGGIVSKIHFKTFFIQSLILLVDFIALVAVSLS